MSSHDDSLVTVFTAADQATLNKAKVTLDAGGIEYSTRNERSPDIGFCGRMVSITGFTGPPEIQVRARDETRARELLEVDKRSPDA
jgi:hypothetical protein